MLQLCVFTLCISFRPCDFELTPECLVFDILNIGLYHGWLVDPQDSQIVNAVGSLSYNQLVEKIIRSKEENSDENTLTEGIHSLTTVRLEELRSIQTR